PPAFGIDAAAKGVHAGVEVGANPDAVHPRVVADVHDGGEFVIARWPGAGASELPQSQQLLDTEQEPGATDAADQNGDLHIDRD
ncbi:MAG: hypothetical protein QOI90_2092, partial [Mycobacterium sp.]|nr:hypothetical protein [Mycobacterium sp.]